MRAGSLIEKAVAALAVNGHFGPLTSTGTADKILSFTGMDDRAEVRRRKALDCERAVVTDLDLRRTYFDLARQWRETAAQVEELKNWAQ